MFISRHSIKAFSFDLLLKILRLLNIMKVVLPSFSLKFVNSNFVQASLLIICLASGSANVDQLFWVSLIRFQFWPSIFCAPEPSHS